MAEKRGAALFFCGEIFYNKRGNAISLDDGGYPEKGRRRKIIGRDEN